MADTTITTTFVTTPAMVLRSYRACSRRGYVQRVAISTGLLLVGGGLCVAGATVPDGVPAGTVLVLWGAGFFLLRERSVRRQLAPYLAGERKVTVTMTDTEYRTQGPDRSTSRTWTTFRSVSRVGDFWVLRVSPQLATGLPVAALDEQQTAAFLTLLREKGLDRTTSPRPAGPASAAGRVRPVRVAVVTVLPSTVALFVFLRLVMGFVWPVSLGVPVLYTVFAWTWTVRSVHRRLDTELAARTAVPGDGTA
ncbi:hypothetical protein ACFXDH_15385 [Streptomyces sp. NPDC059467]|uniref:hypothetical protein n=1 Tax=Streptomyces sp. NPDC059467 TaxID=3346844 RepID=UPI003687DB62